MSTANNNLNTTPLTQFTQLVQDSQDNLDAFIKQAWKSHHNAFKACGKGTLHHRVYEAIINLQLALAHTEDDLMMVKQLTETANKKTNQD